MHKLSLFLFLIFKREPHIFQATSEIQDEKKENVLAETAYSISYQKHVCSELQIDFPVLPSMASSSHLACE